MSIKKYAVRKGRLIISICLVMCVVILTPGVRAFAGSQDANFINEMLRQSSYRVYQNDKFIKEFASYDQSAVFASNYSKCVIKRQGVLWHNYTGAVSVDIVPLADAGEYEVYQSGTLLREFTSYVEAVSYAKRWGGCVVTGEIAVWSSFKEYRVVDLDSGAAPPELPDDIYISDKASLESLTYAVYQNGGLLFETSDRSAAEKLAKKYAEAVVLAYGTLWEYYSFSEAPVMQEGIYHVYQKSELLKSFDKYDDAVMYAQKWGDSCIMGAMIVWHNLSRLSNDQLGWLAEYTEFDSLADAVSYAKASPSLAVISSSEGIFDKSLVVWENTAAKGSATIKNVPIIMQMPQLPRGCEVTSLCMLLNFNDVSVNKMKLAEEVRKSPLKYDDPNNGFIGNMYTFNAHGLGVYHSPIAELAEKYLPGEIADMTGCEFEDVFYFLDRGQPVWIIINSWFSVLPQSQFITWYTPSGPIQVTYREHSVLVVGYDKNYIYYNDPLSGAYKRASRTKFTGGWEQMGRQAVVRIP